MPSLQSGNAAQSERHARAGLDGAHRSRRQPRAGRASPRPPSACKRMPARRSSCRCRAGRRCCPRRRRWPSGSRRPACWSGAAALTQRSTADLVVRVDAANPLLLMARAMAGDKPRGGHRRRRAAGRRRQLAAAEPALGRGGRPGAAVRPGGGLPAAPAGLGRWHAACAAAAARAALRRSRERSAAPPARHEAFLRLVFIVFTVLRFGLDEVALSGFRQRWVRALVRMVTLGRRLDAAARRAPAPGAGAAGPDLRQVRPGAVDPARPAAAGRGRRTGPAAGPRAAVSGRAGRGAGREGLRPAASTRCSRSSTPSRWPAPRSRRCTSRR